MTAEAGAVRIISYAIRDFQMSHGQSPTNWGQLAEFRDIEAINKATFPIKEHYVFVGSLKIQHSDPSLGDVFLIRTDPTTNNPAAELGRYMISRNAGDFMFSWLAEGKIQQMLASAGVTELPKPEIGSVPKEEASTKVSTPVNAITSPVLANGGQQRTASADDPSNQRPKDDHAVVSNTVSPTLQVSTPGGGTSWFGIVVVLGLGFFVSIFLLKRAKQK